MGYSPKRLTAVWTKANNDDEQLQENDVKISPEASSYLLNGIVKYVHEKLNLTDWETPLADCLSKCLLSIWQFAHK